MSKATNDQETTTQNHEEIRNQARDTMKKMQALKAKLHIPNGAGLQYIMKAKPSQQQLDMVEDMIKQQVMQDYKPTNTTTDDSQKKSGSKLAQYMNQKIKTKV